MRSESVTVRWLDRLRAALLPGRSTSDHEPEPVRVVPTFKSTAGVYINQDNALKNATVWACTTYLARTVAQLPWRVLRELPNGKTERATAHPVDWLLRKRPNPEMSAFAFREVMVGWAVRWGNAVAEIQRDARGVPVALWPIHPSRIEFKRDAETGLLKYEINNGADGTVTLYANDVFHVRGFGEGPVGLDVVSYAAESIGWAQATELFGAAFFGNGANPAGLLIYEGKLSPEGKEAAEEDFDKRFGGPRKANRTMVVDKGWKFEKSGVPPDNAQFIETRQHQVEEICRWFGVPPHKVMHLLRSTFSNIEHQAIEVVVDSVTPWVIRFEQEADYKFFGQNRQLFFTKMDLKGLLRGDYKSRQEGLQIMRRNGVINADQWALLEDMDPPGPANGGDKYIVEGNMTTLEAVGKAPVPAASPAGSPQENADQPQDESPVQRARAQAARALLH